MHVTTKPCWKCHRHSGVEEVCALMAEAPAWADGLPLRADGYECEFYKKD